MTNGSLKPAKEKRSRKNKQIVPDEKVPLLPTKHEEDVGFDEFNGASFTGAVFNFSIVGAGIMSLPATMKVLGLAPGIAMIVFMAFLTDTSIEMLLRFSRTGKNSSYAGVMNDTFEKYGRMLLQVCVLVNNIGVLVVNMIIIVMCFLEQLKLESTMQVFWKGSLECIGGMAILLLKFQLVSKYNLVNYLHQ